MNSSHTAAAADFLTSTTPFATVNTEEDTTAAPYYANIPLEYFYFSLHLAIFIISLLGNSLALVALLTTTSNLYAWFFNLVTADLVKTVICMPYSLYILWEYTTYRTNVTVIPPLCGEVGVIFLSCLLVSLVSNAAISMDRVVAITSPIFYANSQRRLSPLVPILSTWVAVVGVCLLPYFYGGYYYTTFTPACSLELHNLLNRYLGAMMLRVVAGFLNALFFGLPILIVCVSCAIVSYKLFRKSSSPKVRKKRKHNEFDGAVLPKSDSIRSNVTNVTKTSRVSVDDSPLSVEQFTVTEPQQASSTWCTDQPAWSDKMELLHSTPAALPKKNNSIARRQRLQRKAGVTMGLVAITFFLCHICLFTLWALWDVIGVQYSCSLADKGPPNQENWSYGYCVAFHTLHITLVYLNSPLNVIIYYYRCSYLRVRMGQFVGRMLRGVCLPCTALSEAIKQAVISL